MTQARFIRRGSIYIAVLGTSALIWAIALAAMIGTRIGKRSSGDDTDFSEARIYARAGLEIGMHYISTDPYWRLNKGNGSWATNIPIGRGTFSLTAMDPVDNDVRYGENHPVVLTSTGFKGNAQCKMSVRLEIGPKSGSCMEVSLCSGSDCVVNQATLTSDQTASTNRNFIADGATVNANVEAFRQFNGSTYTKSKKLITRARYLPDPFHVFDSYVAAGTPISYTALPQASQTELVSNTDFELNVNGWNMLVASPAKIAQDTANFAGGLASLQVSARKKTTDVASQDLPIASIIQGHSYSLRMSIYTSATVPIQATLVTVNTAGAYWIFSTAAVTPAANTWCTIQGTVSPTWTGTLSRAILYLTTTNATADYNMDNVSVKDTTYKSGAYYLEHRLLSPSSNPFGAANANGIYVLDCGGKDVIIADSRIVGTLMLKHAGSNSSIRGSMNWQPAVANYPALLTDSSIEIKLNSTALSEATLALNFNPPGSPYPYAGGTANTTATDSYPSQISGIVYSSNDMDLSGQTTIFGQITVGGKTKISGTSLKLTYSNIFYNTPPPGFDVGGVPMNPVPGTWQRVTQ